MRESSFHPHSSHWGAFAACWDGQSLSVKPHPGDPYPNALLGNFASALRHSARVTGPAVRRGWLERGPGPDHRRGREEFVKLPWDEVLDRLAADLMRVERTHGPAGIYGGSYGWASAGRFHHAQSQLHRFLNTTLGGYVRSENSYSAGASSVILPHVLGPWEKIARNNVTWAQITAHTDVVLAFGGMALRNMQVASGGISMHTERDSIAQAADRGCKFFNFSPLRTDLQPVAGSEWVPVTPGGDTALMLALANCLMTNGWHDEEFIESHCDGWPVLRDYVLGLADKTPKTPDWAQQHCRVPASDIRRLASLLPGKRVLVVVSHSLQRAEYGEQPVWMGAALAALLGQIGLPGGGFNYALGTLAHYGKRNNVVRPPALPQGKNGVSAFIPVARVSDMLLHPGEVFEYNGRTLTYPRISLAYWAGGNLFHHHQDLRRLTQAVAKLDTFVVHETAWTATARHADIVLPATMTLEREDIGATPTDPLVIAMHRVAPPIGQARDDYDIFCDLAYRLGRRDAFSEGRSSREWVEHLYETLRCSLQDSGFATPDFPTFWSAGELSIPQADDDGGLLRAFRVDPAAYPLPTPSGKIQLSSPIIASFCYDDCPGHPAWLAPTEAPDSNFPFWLIANQPASRLHSQFDFGDHSQSTKRHGREVCTMHTLAAKQRGLVEGDIARLYNARGACLVAVATSEDMLPDVLQLPTGAWFDPVEIDGDLLCGHGNPNMLTRDVGTSRLAQGCTGQVTIAQIERFDGPLPSQRCYFPPYNEPKT